MEISFDPTKPTLESDTREQRFWKRSVQRYDERSIVRNAIRRTVTRYVTGCSTRSRVKINADLYPNPLHRGEYPRCDCIHIYIPIDRSFVIFQDGNQDTDIRSYISF